MVEITNGVSTIVVTKGAFEGVYKSQGYSLKSDLAINSNASQVTPENDGEIISEETSANKNQELIEKPISQWTKAEVKQFAADNEIALDGTKNVNEAKEIIKNFIAENHLN